MQIGAISTSAQSIMSSSNIGVDGSQRTATEIPGAGKPDDAVQASGKVSSSQAVQPPEASASQVAAAQNDVALQTQVVTSADEVLGTNIDTTA